MSKVIAREFVGPDGQPAYFPNGIRVGEALGGGVNDIGVPGAPGFGAGVCPGPLPNGMYPMEGFSSPTHANYGNYVASDGSQMVWIPVHYHKWGTGDNGVALNEPDIKPIYHFPTLSDAVSQGYTIDRAFYDGGAIQPGVFVDKYQCSNNGGIASSLRFKDPLVAHSSASSPLSDLNGSPSNDLAGAVDAAKTRGAGFFVLNRFIWAMLARLSLAHALNSTSTTWCAWYHPINNFPKGNNNNALGDSQDGDLVFQSAGDEAYPNKALTGSANFLDRTTHNGQLCGVADLNGNLWESTPGITVLDDELFILSPSARMSELTSGASNETDLWGSSGVAANYESLGESFEVWNETGAERSVDYGSATGQVFSSATSGLAWAWACAGGMLTTGQGGTNIFGNDRFYGRVVNHLCPRSGGHWTTGSIAGVWALYLNASRTHSHTNHGFRSALFLGHD